jgi:MobA/MobL family
MALFHVHAAVIRKGAKGGSAGFATYMAREDVSHASQAVRYITRKGREGTDLVSKGYGSLPVWARDNPTYFFAMADRYERGGVKRPGTVARTYEIALPRELSAPAREALAADIRATFFERFPHGWAVHNPRDDQGFEHPHMHLMFSERRQTDGVQRLPGQYFTQPAWGTQDPTTHGVRKDRSWQGPHRLQEVRAGVALLINAALEREGHADVAVSHESLKDRAFGRDPAIYTWKADRARVEQERQDVYRDYLPLENALNVLAWQQQKTREHLTDLSREAIVDHVRDRFWRQDRSPQREQERQESLLRTLARQVPLPQHQREPVRTRLHWPRVWGHGWGLDDTMQHGVTTPMAHEHDHER